MRFSHAPDTGQPLNYFLHSYGPASRSTMYLGWVFTAITVGVCIVVAVLLLAAIVRHRPASDIDAIGKEKEGMAWVYIGTGISTCILLGLSVYSLIILNAVAQPPAAPALSITVTAYDWWWKIEYGKEGSVADFVTANEIHIPVGRPVLIKLNSADVIHSFWVPKLAGKTQTIPGLTNQQWIQADIPGIYSGQCTQFCGDQHAHMAFEVVAQSDADFTRWRAAQSATKPSTASAQSSSENSEKSAEGEKLFQERCAGCHAVRGTTAQGIHGPDLTHLGSRRLIAAGMLTNTPEHVLDWIEHAQQIKPESRMPSIALSPAEASDISTYLSTLD